MRRLVIPVRVEQLEHLRRLLDVALAAAGAINVGYVRGEVRPNPTLDRLVGSEAELRKALEGLRGLVE
jgi:hypothetical protein